MKVSDCMTPGVRLLAPDATVQDAARIMAETGTGVLPVGDDNRLVGILTDRDIVVRALGAGRGLDTTVGEIMSPEVVFCLEDADADEAALQMGELQVRRFPVVNTRQEVVGIVSLGDLARRGAHVEVIGEALSNISGPESAGSRIPF